MTRAEIKCLCLDSETELEISKCNIFFLYEENRPIYNSTLGYKYKFNKNTKYMFPHQTIFVLFDDVGEHVFEFIIYDISVQFEYYRATCVVNNRERTINITNYMAPILVYPCYSVGDEYLEDSDIDREVTFFDNINQKIQEYSPWLLPIFAFALMVVIIAFLVYYIANRPKKWAYGQTSLTWA
ncbi:hypothetical protein RF11_15585 [Thelohanellus kitauei]|uniref:Uncharacterized protein n=1 Tax=Thelohanellus kitauei TaxID=669202 RepID=A0A0C2MSY1_THEKT|nr:hypothetical protein RF11_15585 [Thelohanellus kitauei]